VVASVFGEQTVTNKKNGAGGKLVKLGFISDDEITNFLSQQYRIPKIDMADYEIDPAIISAVPKDICEKHRVVPVSRTGRSLIVAMADPDDLTAIEELKSLSGYNIEPVVATETGILEAIARYYG
jgi:type IV pilus assembly protein PilB